MDINKIKTGRPKPRFVIALEWLTLGTLTVVLMSILLPYVVKMPQFVFQVSSFLLIIEVGLLSILYGAEGLRYRFIWFTFPTLSGPRRAGFSGLASILIGAAYVLMGLMMVLMALFLVYLSTPVQS